MKEWIKASEKFPEEGKPESLIGKHCRIRNTKMTCIVSCIAPHQDVIIFLGKNAINGKVSAQDIEWLLETEEEPKTNNDSKVMSAEEWFQQKYPRIKFETHWSSDERPIYDRSDMSDYASYVLQHSASRLEIKLPEKDMSFPDPEDENKDYSLGYKEGRNYTIEEIKYINGITE